MRENHLTGVERTFPADEIIVSKTDLQGKVTYANDLFLSIAGYTEREVLGQPHSIIRHPNMPRCVFKLLWETIQSGEECFAYVVNRCKNGDEYWVLAHVTPTHDAQTGKLVGYHSSRRAPSAAALARIKPLYAELLAVERGNDRKGAIEASTAVLNRTLAQLGLRYEQFIFSTLGRG